MSKLHLIKPRKNKATLEGDVTDLRGLGTDDVLKKSFLYGRMSILGVTSNQVNDLKQIIEQYDCTVHSTENDGEIVIQHKNQMEGMHKFHAVALFTSALSLAHHFPKAHFYIYENSGLHEQMKKSIFGKKPKSTPGFGKELKSDVWTQFNTKVTLSPVVSYHLHQSGYAVEKKSDATFLTEKDLQVIREHLFNEVVVETDKKKAA